MKYLNYIYAILTFLIYANSICAQTDLNKIYEERKNCLLTVRYMVNFDEGKDQRHAVAIAINDDGLLLLPANAIPTDIPVKMLTDFKAFLPNDKSEGMDCEYLGTEPFTNMHFLQIKSQIPSTLVSIKKFKISEPKISDKLWGLSMCGESFFYDFSYSYAELCYILKDPILRYISGTTIATIGAPVFDNSGGFVGIVISDYGESKILKTSEGTINVYLYESFAGNLIISAKHVYEASERIPNNPHGVKTGHMGILDMQVVKHEVAKMLGFKNDEAGLVVGNVIEDCAAQKAGIKKSDIIVGLNSKRLQPTIPEEELSYKFYLECLKFKPKDKITLDVIKAGESEITTVEVTLCESLQTERQSQREYFKKLGFSVREFIFEDAYKRRILNTKTKGAVVSWVKENSPAASAQPDRLYRGDWVKEINSQKVESFEDAVKILEEIEKDSSIKEVVLMLEGSRETRVARIKLD